MTEILNSKLARIQMAKPRASRPGRFITIYGVNNIGKTTHARLLVERLKKAGYDAVYLKYPIYGLKPTGKQLNTILRSNNAQQLDESELQMLFAQNRRDFEPQLRKMLQAGKIVIAEDYTGTGIAWGMAKGLARQKLEKINKALLKEDFTILLSGQPDTKAKEINHLHEQNNLLLQRVSKIFVQLGKAYGWHQIKIKPKIGHTAEIIWWSVKNFLQKRQ